MLGITMVAAPGVPEVLLRLFQGILQSMPGFLMNRSGIDDALYIAMDSFWYSL